MGHGIGVAHDPSGAIAPPPTLARREEEESDDGGHAAPRISACGHLRRHAEIGFEHARIGVDHGGGALGQLAALLEHDHLVAEVGDEIDIVLDDEEGDALGVQLLRLDHGLRDALDHGRIDAGHRLIEHDQAGGRGIMVAAMASSLR